MTEIKIAGKTIGPASQSVKRITMLLWGSAGIGKTTLACTAPGKKLLVNFDPDGQASVAGWDDVDVLDLSDAPIAQVVEGFKKVNDPMGLSAAIEDYDTIIFDSLTNIGHKALMHAIATTPKATLEFPGIPAYAVRNMYMTQLVKNVLSFTNKHSKNCIFIAHEGAPVTNDEGMVLHITMALSGDMPNRAALDFSEVWYMMEANKSRRILVRPGRNRKPMKTRMFETAGEIEFEWLFDADDQDGMRIADWYAAWQAGNLKKLPIPSAKVKK